MPPELRGVPPPGWDRLLSFGIIVLTIRRENYLFFFLDSAAIFLDSAAISASMRKYS
jgi:hypothetical protein